MYSFNSRVRYSEVDRNGKLDIPAVINYFQDCSTFQSESLDMGVEYLRRVKKAWVLNSWQIEFIKLPALLDNIEIGTWSYGSNGVYGYRNFVLNDENGERLVNANSLWVLTDIESGRPLKVEKGDVEAYGQEPKIEMTDYGRKIKADGTPQEKPSFNIRKYHIDTNGHVNNAIYVQFAMEYLPENAKVNVLRVEYKKSAVYGDIICPVAYEEESRLTVELNDENGVSYAKVQFIL